MDKQNFYQEKYEYYRTLNLWAVVGISIPSIGYFFSDCYLLGGFSADAAGYGGFMPSGGAAAKR